jgi:cytochrome b involved in lipid metabolism
MKQCSLQRQIKFNSTVIRELEEQVEEYNAIGRNYRTNINKHYSFDDVDNLQMHINKLKKVIVKYVELQKDLKRDLCAIILSEKVYSISVKHKTYVNYFSNGNTSIHH